MELRKRPELIEVHSIVGGEVDAKNIIGLDGGTYRLDNIITVCGLNYCIMTAFQDDRSLCRKVYKINDKVLIGATGTFNMEENPLDPLIGTHSKSISLEETTKAVENYLIDKRIDVSVAPDRKYIIAGREYDGQFCIVSVEFANEYKELRRRVFRPSAESIATAVSMSKYLGEHASEFFNEFKSKLLKCNDAGELRRYVEGLVLSESDTHGWPQVSLGIETKIIL